MDFASFQDDDRLVRAVEMNSLIIGEAGSQILDDVEEQYPEILWPLMRAMRNRIVHFLKIDEKWMWNTIQQDLPPLVPLLK